MMNEDSDIFCLTGASVLREWENNFCLHSNQLGLYTESSRVFGLDPSIYPSPCRVRFSRFSVSSNSDRKRWS